MELNFKKELIKEILMNVKGVTNDRKRKRRKRKLIKGRENEHEVIKKGGELKEGLIIIE